MTEYPATHQQPAYQPPPGQPYGYGPPPWQMQPEPRNGLGLTALILGCIGILFGIVPLTGFIAFGLGATGLIVGLSNFGRLKRRIATNKVMTWFGVATSGLALVLGVIGMAIFFTAVNDLGNDLQQIDQDMSRYEQCVDQADTTEEMLDC